MNARESQDVNTARVIYPCPCDRRRERPLTTTSQLKTGSPRDASTSGGSVIPGKGNDMGNGIRQMPRGSRGHMPKMQIMDAMGPVVYAARLADGKIKIGHTEHFGDRLRRLKSYVGQEIELIGFRFGTFDDEQALHASLVAHRAQGAQYALAREYYEPVPEVLEVINDMRASFGLPPLAA